MITLVGTIPNKVIVVDSLDLCEEDSEIGSSWLTVETLIQAIVWLAESLHRNQLPLQIFVTSQPHLHRKAKRTIPKFHTEAKSLYLYPHGLLDSVTDGKCLFLSSCKLWYKNNIAFLAWSELRNLSAQDARDTRHDSSSGNVTPMQDSVFFAPDGLMSHISNWFENNDGHQVCWLKYPVRQYGTKSSIAQLIAAHCSSRGALAANISCSDETVNSRTFLPSLAFQIGQSMPTLRPSMQQIIQDEREIMLTPDDHTFARKLIVEPFLTGDLHLISPMIVVIDSIGWQEDDFLLSTLIWLENAFRSHTIPLQIFVTSEPDLYTRANLQFPSFLDNALTLHLPRLESWTSVPRTPSQSLFVNRGQKIYQVC